MKSIYIKPFSIILIFCLGCIAYFNSFHCSFHFDDATSITDDFAIRNIHDLQSIWNYWPSRFITYLSIALNYHFNGIDVFGYHLVNLAIHLLSAVLVWWLVLLTLSTPTMKENTISRHANLIALLAGLVFVSHPLQTQAVTYIVQRATSMAALFYVASLCFYIKSRLLFNRRTQGLPLHIILYICSLISAILAMFTKENTITLPLMVLLYEFSFFKTKKSFNWGHVIPFLLTLFIIPLTMLFTKSVNFQEMHRVIEAPAGMSSMQYLLTQFRVMATYIRLVFLPFNQNLDYDYSISNSLFEFPTAISLLFLMIILFSAVRLFSKYRLVSFSIFWFFLTLLPESSIVPIRDVIYEHRLYLPLVGYSLFLASSVYYLPKNIFKTTVIILFMVIAFNSILTYQRNKVWKDEFSLWKDTIAKSPHKARPNNNYGKVYLDQGNFTQAMLYFNKAIAIDPKYALAYNNRGIIYEKQVNFPQALSNYSKAIEIDPHYADAYFNRGNAYKEQKNFAQALSGYTQAISIDPNLAEAYNNRGSILEDQGKLTEAIADFNKAIELKPEMAEAYNNLGSIYGKQGNFIQAMSEYTRAIELNPALAEAYFNRGSIYHRQGKLTEATSDFSKAVEINPKLSVYVNQVENPQVYYNRGSILLQQGNFTQAIVDFNKAIELNPNYAEAYTNRGYAYDSQSNFTQAISDYTRAITLSPKLAGAYNNRGNTYLEQGNFTQATADFNKAIELNPNIAQTYYNLGIIDVKQEELNEAVVEFTKAIEISPDYADAYNNRAVTYYKLQEYDKAWADEHKVEALGAAVNAGLVNALKAISGQDK